MGNQALGRYWGWDPTETWSLIVWYIILSLFVLAFSLFGIGYMYSGLHTDYLTS
jgi:ABC-type transport system involved in cytochrome c biogenesis permease subunit